jgi:hypothetical protein
VPLRNDRCGSQAAANFCADHGGTIDSGVDTFTVRDPERIFGATAAAGSLNKLLMIYCGLVCVALASTIFASCCPLEVKKYASSEEYISGEEPFLSSRAKGILEMRLKTGDEVARSAHSAYRDWGNSRPTVDTLEEIRLREKELFRIEMNLFYDMMDRSCAVGRWSAGVLYSLGFLFLLWPAISVFVKVMIVLAKNVGVEG